MKLLQLFLPLLALLHLTHAQRFIYGMKCKKSEFPAHVTMDRFESVLRSRNLTVYSRIRHHENAREIGIVLRPTDLIIFGNPVLGSQLLLREQSIGIDLPMKALVFEDEEGKVFLSYNEPYYIAWRHRFGDQGRILSNLSRTLDDLTETATKINPGPSNLIIFH